MINALLILLQKPCQLRPSNYGGKAEGGWSTSKSGNWHTQACPPPTSP
ncbi:hypothetical protein FXN70_01250 [Acinetobacter sp. MD2]|nr:hypothetical protein [Acinetobacter sp. MD2]